MCQPVGVVGSATCALVMRNNVEPTSSRKVVGLFGLCMVSKACLWHERALRMSNEATK